MKRMGVMQSRRRWANASSGEGRLPALMLALLSLLLLLTQRTLANGGPHGEYLSVTDACSICHRSHRNQNPELVYSPEGGNAFCYSCHDGTGASIPPIVSTHSNAAFAERQEASFELLCVQCHEPHGHESNLRSVREWVRVSISPEVITGPVIFTSRTGSDSFDEMDGSDVDDLCVTCHINSANGGYPMNCHPGGDHTAAGGEDERGNDCTGCHRHDADGDRLTRDGFMPGDE